MENGGQNKGGSLGLMSCVAILIGGMIGSAIFSLSGNTIYNAGPAAILTWVLAACIMMMYGMQVAELSTIFPKSGGVFVFPSKALGNGSGEKGQLWGWISTWGYINANIVAIAFAAIYVATYLGVAFPVFAGMQVPLALAACVLVIILNSLRIAVAGKANTVLVCALVATLLIFICVGLFGGEWNGAQLSPFFSQGAGGTGGFLAMVPVAMVAYGSVVAIAFMVSEVKDPNKNVPKSMMIAMGTVVVLYGLVILSTVGLITAGFLEESPGMRFIPLYAAAFTKLSHVSWLPALLSISAVLALLTTMLVVLALTSRALAAAAGSNIVPKKLAEVNAKTGTPFYATLVIGGMAMVVSCFPQFTAEIVSFAALFATVTISINVISLITARKNIPYKEGNYRAPGGKVLPVLTLAILIVCYIPDIVSGGWVIWAYTIGWYLLGLLIFYLGRGVHVVELEGEVRT